MCDCTSACSCCSANLAARLRAPRGSVFQIRSAPPGRAGTTAILSRDHHAARALKPERTGRRFIEFFIATIRNRNTRMAYARAVKRGVVLPLVVPDREVCDPALGTANQKLIDELVACRSGFPSTSRKQACAT